MVFMTPEATTKRPMRGHQWFPWREEWFVRGPNKSFNQIYHRDLAKMGAKKIFFVSLRELADQLQQLVILESEPEV